MSIIRPLPKLSVPKVIINNLNFENGIIELYLFVIIIFVGPVTAIRAIFAVTILITVLVAILIAIAASGLGAVEEYDKVVVALGDVILVDLREHGALKQAGTDNEYGHVSKRSDYVCIRNDLNGRTVEENVVIVRA